VTGCSLIVLIKDTTNSSSVMNKGELKWLSISVISQSEMVWLSKDVARRVTLSMAWSTRSRLSPPQLSHLWC
jgi:hypothetical protein